MHCSGWRVLCRNLLTLAKRMLFCQILEQRVSGLTYIKRAPKNEKKFKISG